MNIYFSVAIIRPLKAAAHAVSPSQRTGQNSYVSRWLGVSCSPLRGQDRTPMCPAGWVCPAAGLKSVPTCGAETLSQSSPMFGDFSLPWDQISGQNKKSLNTFVSGKKESHLSVGHCGHRPAPLYIRPIYLTQQQTSKQHKGAICKTNMAGGWTWINNFYTTW
ncbi:Flavin-dependent halogenase malA [Dissostichus eleginoides]|uniref:Flavin-dependent halogenase malA n=1 Tax=Dissostichus eleginoides TaxID=100907 RepID=A0AAD9BZZ2_DISEL|nr:Flavin-dependent halogenase malA [Dissostichus eleginoides]